LGIPLCPQPAVESVVVICSYYTALKSDSSYRKRVSWLQSSPAVALYEYSGKPRGIHPPHGSAKLVNVEYVRTKPSVMDRIDVYERLAFTAETSLDRPRDEKQVRNKAQFVEKDKHVSKNPADELQKLIGSMQDHDFIKDVLVRNGRSPIVIAYTETQLQDI